MRKVISPEVHDTMSACSRKLFNAAQDGDFDYAMSVISRTIETLTLTLRYQYTVEGETNGSN